MSLNFAVDDINNSINYEVSGDKYYAGLAEEWATSLTKVQNKDYSAKYYSNLAAQASETASTAAQVVIDSSENIDVIIDNISDINTTASNISDINSIAADLSNINSVAGNYTNINIVAANTLDISSVAGISTDITQLASISSDITSVANIKNAVSAVSNNQSNIDTVANNISNIDSVAGSLASVNSVASDLTNVNAVAGDLTNINSVVNNLSNINAVNNNSTNINAVAGSILNISSVAGNLSNINAVANDLTNINNASTYADNSAVWAEGTDNQVASLGGIHSAKEWANVASQGQIQANWNETDTSSKAYIQNKPTIPTVPTNLSSFTDDLGTNPIHTHSQYLTQHQDISGKEDKLKLITVLNTSGTITLTDNSVNSITPTGSVTFTLPTVTDNTVFHQILVQVNLSTVVSISVGTTYYFNKIAPDMSEAGVYNLIYEYDKANQYWVCGVLSKGSAS